MISLLPWIHHLDPEDGWKRDLRSNNLRGGACPREALPWSALGLTQRKAAKDAPINVQAPPAKFKKMLSVRSINPLQLQFVAFTAAFTAVKQKLAALSPPFVSA